MRQSDIDKIEGEEDLFWCPRCKEFKWCPRGSCEAEIVGKLVTKAVIDDNAVYDSKPWNAFENDEEKEESNEEIFNSIGDNSPVNIEHTSDSSNSNIRYIRSGHLEIN